VSGIIVYRSSYGSTRQYAEWIHEETGFPLFDHRDQTIPWNVDTTVLGCPIIASKPYLLGWMQKNWERMRESRVLLFTTSGADPAVAPVREWIEQALPEDMRSAVRVFPLAGRFRFSELGILHKVMMGVGALILRNEGIKYRIAHPVDNVARENLDGLLRSIKAPSALH